MSRSVPGESEVLQIVELSPAAGGEDLRDAFAEEPDGSTPADEQDADRAARSPGRGRPTSPARIRAAAVVVVLVSAVVLAYALGFGMGRRSGTPVAGAPARSPVAVVPMPAYPYSADVYGDFGPCDRSAQTSIVLDLDSPAVRALRSHFPTYLVSSLATSTYTDNGNVCSVNLQAVDQSGVTMQVIINYSGNATDRTSWSSSHALGQYSAMYSRADSRGGQRVRVMLSSLSPQVMPKYPAVSSFANDPVLLTQPG